VPTSRTEVVRAAFDAYRAQDHDAAEELMAEELTFTSPQDDHIDRAAYFERCFPTADRLVSQEVLELVDAGEDGVFILYEYELKTGERHRNTEFITVRDGRIVEIQVFFGGRV
jgi:ketosteroid isomerase-like protein